MLIKNKQGAIGKYWPAVVFTLLCIGFIIIRLDLLQSSTHVLVWFDSFNYVSISRENIWSKAFWFGWQPPLYPFFLKYFFIPPEQFNTMACCKSYIPGVVVKPATSMLGAAEFQYVINNYFVSAIVVAQWLISVSSWILLASSLFRRLTQPVLKLTATLIILSLGCELSIVIWDRNLLTESLSISFLVLIISILINGFNKDSRGSFIILMLIFTLFVALRVTHVFFVALSTIWLGIALYRIKKFGWITSLLILVGVLFTANQYTLLEAKRSYIPIRSVVSSRIMSSGFEEIRSYFESNGMPTVPDDVIGKLWHGPYSNYPDLDKWIHNDASKLYQKFLVTHPVYFFLKPFVRYNKANESLIEVFVPYIAWQTPKNQNGLNIYFTNEVLFLLVLLPVVLYFGYIRRKNIQANFHLMGLGAFLMASGFLLALINWHGDLVEVNRHILPSMLQIRLGLLVLLIGSLDFSINSNPAKNNHD